MLVPRRRSGVLAVSAFVALVAFILASCSSDGASDVDMDAGAPDASAAVDGEDGSVEGDGEDPGDPGPRFRYPAAPSSPDATERNEEAAELIDRFNEVVGAQAFDFAAVSELGSVGDPRHAWFVSDLLQFFGGAEGDQLVDTFESLTGVNLSDDPDSERSPWLSATNHLIAWDVPAYPGYPEDKSEIYLLLESGWAPFFGDEESAIDWRLVSWGGVFIDDRELGDPNPCPDGCIPALDDPDVTDAAGGDWYPDERVVFGIVEGGEALAIPLNIAEVHEMFNLTLGGRRLGIPYCTLCGSAQAYYTDGTGADEPPVLRTSGLLSRSNKVMYDLRTGSVFDTFTGAAVSGPLREQDVALDETTVVRSTWGEWKEEHPDTTIVAEDGGIERSYQLDPLGGRDDDGPIFPVGSVDDRLGEQEFVVGVIAPDGTPVAFPADAAGLALELGEEVSAAGVSLRASGDGLVAEDDDGNALAAHEAFWFAWSQFHPDTALWTG